MQSIPICGVYRYSHEPSIGVDSGANHFDNKQIVVFT